MTLSEFQALLATHGPVVDGWPAPLIEDALDLLGRSSDAQTLFVKVSEDEETHPPAAMVGYADPWTSLSSPFLPN